MIDFYFGWKIILLLLNAYCCFMNGKNRSNFHTSVYRKWWINMLNIGSHAKFVLSGCKKMKFWNAIHCLIVDSRCYWLPISNLHHLLWWETKKISKTIDNLLPINEMFNESRIHQSIFDYLSYSSFNDWYWK